MNITDTYLNLIDRTLGSMDRIPELSAEQVNARPAGHPNSVAWNLWHAARVIDAMGAAGLAEQPQVWDKYRAQFDLGDVAEGTGFGHTADEAAAITGELPLLREYLTESLQALRTYVATLQDEDFDEIIGEFAGQPESRQDRLSLILIDALQHIGQVQFVAGMTHA